MACPRIRCYSSICKRNIDALDEVNQGPQNVFSVKGKVIHLEEDIFSK